MNDHIPDVTKMISDTPRTNSVIARDTGDSGLIAELASECSKMECELNAANQRIKRLEEALNEIELAMKQPASNHRLMQIAGPARQVINIIKKSKEAKL